MRENLPTEENDSDHQNTEPGTTVYHQGVI